MSEIRFNIYKAISELASNNKALIYETAYEVIKNYFVWSTELCTIHLVTKYAILRICYDFMQEKCLGKVSHSSLYTAVFTVDRLTKLYSSKENNILY